jgi:hypothetical protein
MSKLRLREARGRQNRKATAQFSDGKLMQRSKNAVRTQAVDRINLTCVRFNRWNYKVSRSLGMGGQNNAPRLVVFAKGQIVNVSNASIPFRIETNAHRIKCIAIV